MNRTILAAIVVVSLIGGSITAGAFTPVYTAPTAFGWMSIMQIHSVFHSWINGSVTQVSATQARTDRERGYSKPATWDSSTGYETIQNDYP